MAMRVTSTFRLLSVISWLQRTFEIKSKCKLRIAHLKRYFNIRSDIVLNPQFPILQSGFLRMQNSNLRFMCDLT